MYCKKCYNRVKPEYGYCEWCRAHPVMSETMKGLVIAFGSLLAVIMWSGLVLFIISDDSPFDFIESFFIILFTIVITILVIKAIIPSKRKLNILDNITGIIKHYDGLPISRGSFLKFTMYIDKIVFEKDSQEITLNRDKIIFVDMVSGDDLKNNNESMMGMMAGSMVVGGVGGAILGSALAKSKYLAITYKSGDEIKFIFFDTAGSNLPFIQIINDFKNDDMKAEVKIEL